MIFSSVCFSSNSLMFRRLEMRRAATHLLCDTNRLVIVASLSTTQQPFSAVFLPWSILTIISSYRFVDWLPRPADSFLGRGLGRPWLWTVAGRAVICRWSAVTAFTASCCGDESWLTVPALPALPDWKDTDIPESAGRKESFRGGDIKSWGIIEEL